MNEKEHKLGKVIEIIAYSILAYCLYHIILLIIVTPILSVGLVLLIEDKVLGDISNFSRLFGALKWYSVYISIASFGIVVLYLRKLFIKQQKGK